jgi:NADH-quinone oxidoreductase subunit C
MSQEVLETIKGRYREKVLGSHNQCGDDTVFLERDVLLDCVQFLKEDPSMSFDMCMDITAVDKDGYAGHTGPRFEMVYHFYSLEHQHRIRLKVRLAEDDIEVDSLSELYGCAEWFEREVWDMFGVRFRGLQDHRRILLYKEFKGHPLRKEYPQRGYQPLIEMPTLPVTEDGYVGTVDEDL